MDNTVKVTARSVYGSTMLYPESPQARRLADLMGTKTLTLTVLSKVQGMGFVVEVLGDFATAAQALSVLGAR